MQSEFFLLNSQGFIPGLKETEEEFKQRVEFCKNLLMHFETNTGEKLPFELTDLASKEALNEAFSLTKHLYGIAPQWVPLFFSNHELAFWHGGCAWIFQMQETAPLAALLQLRRHFRNHSTYLNIYHRKELIAHELAHVGRLMFDEPKFEEFFAYQTSPYRWRRFLGPLIQSSSESLFFIFSLAFVLIADLALFATHYSHFYLANHWLKLIPLFLIFLASIRLFKRHRTLAKCLKHLNSLTSEQGTALHLLYRLSDQEINQFANWPLESIKTYMEQQANTNFRWLFLKTIYLHPKN